MKWIAALAAVSLAASLAACDSGPEVDVKDANADEVAEAVRESGVAGDNGFQVRPGKWESKVELLEIEIPGMPVEMRETMKNTFAQHQQRAFASCLTPEQAKRPKEDFFAGNDQCRYDHFKMGDGRIDAKMRCDAGEGVQVMEMAGTYSPESYTMTMTTLREGGAGPGGEARMKMRVDSRRVGECDKEAA